MSVFDRLAASEAKVERSADQDRLRLKVIKDPVLERAYAIDGAVPKRCGLCKSWSRRAFEDLLGLNAAFAESTRHLRPYQHGGPDSRPQTIPSEAGRELRPSHTESWDDYGLCTRPEYESRALWGFTEQPPMPEPTDKPCEGWA